MRTPEEIDTLVKKDPAGTFIALTQKEYFAYTEWINKAMTNATPDKIAYQSGATNRSKVSRLDLVPFELVDAAGERFALGVPIHGENNWKKGLDDPEYIKSVKAHAIKHLMHYANNTTTYHANGDVDDTPLDNLKAAACRIAMLLWFEANAKETKPDR